MKRLQGYLVALVGLLCLVTASRADEMKVEQFYEDTGDLSGSFVPNQRKDMNGNVCALVKVAFPLEDALFEGNVIGDVEYKAGEYWVYMSPGTKMLRIKHKTATPTMIDFPDYGIPALESKATYNLVIAPPNSGGSKGDGANGSYLVLDITPKTGVFAEVDGKPLAIEDGQASTFLRYGNHTYTVRANGYATYTGTAKIEKGANTTIPVKLESNMATLTIKPETSGVTVKINGKERGMGSVTESIASGTYLIEVEKSGYQPWKETIEIAERENKTLTVPALQPVYGSLNIDYKPIGSTVSIDGKTVGTTPAIIGDLLIGSHNVTISKDGFDTYSSQVSISEAETTNLTGALSETPEIELIPAEKNGKLGYIDKTGKEVIPFKYIFASSFAEGLAAVMHNGKWGYIDKTGKEVIPFIYDFASSFSEGLAPVKLNGKYGYIDKTGKEVIPFKYENADSFWEGFTKVQLNGKQGYIDTTGKVAFPFKYDFVGGDFSEGLATVMLNGKWGYADNTGKEVIPLKYDGAENFSEGLAEVMLNGKYGYIDKNGNEVAPIKYDRVEGFSEGLARVNLNGKWGFIDKNGKEVIPFKYDDAWSYTEGLAAVRLNEKWCYIDKTGKVVIPFRYDYASVFSDGLALVKLNSKWGFIDKNGKEVILFKYDHAYNFSEGFAAVILNGKYGYIDKTGKEVIPFKYDEAWSFKNGKAWVMLNGRRFYIDKNGNEVFI